MYGTYRSSSSLLGVIALLALGFSGCSETPLTSCPDVPQATGPGTFAFRIERGAECYVVRGERAAYGTVTSVYTDEELFLGNLTADDDGDEGAFDLLFEVVALGDLEAGTHDLADLFEAPDLDVPVPTPRLVEHPGKVSVAAILDAEYVWARGGTITVARPTADVVSGSVSARMETASGEEVHVDGVFEGTPGTVTYTFIQ